MDIDPYAADASGDTGVEDDHVGGDEPEKINYGDGHDGSDGQLMTVTMMAVADATVVTLLLVMTFQQHHRDETPKSETQIKTLILTNPKLETLLVLQDRNPALP